MASSPPAGATPTAPIVAPDPAPIVAPAILEADDDDNDSSFGSEGGGSSLNWGSVTSSIYNYRQENGRTYHAYSDGKYLLPNDDKEQDRLDMIYHAVMLMFDGKPFFAPVKNPQRIVDMGTGTGIWALDVGDQYPEAHVIGIDLSPQQPKWTAQNVEFRIDDFEQPWVFDTPIDLVHSRLNAGLAVKNWPHFLAEAYKSLRPGGWVELQEANATLHSDDGSVPEDSKIAQWHSLAKEAFAILGGDFTPTAAGIKTSMEEAGFVNIGVVELKWPIAPWAKDKRLKEAGHMTMISMLEDMTGMSLGFMTRVLNWDRIEVELFLAQVKKEWFNKKIHAYYPLFAVYGQKPDNTKKEDSVEREIGPAASAAT